MIPHGSQFRMCPDDSQIDRVVLRNSTDRT
jgi:hypothetical protein